MLIDEDIYLILIYTQDTPSNHWLKRWEKSYPLSLTVEIDADDDIVTWAKKIDQLIKQVGDNQLMFVTYSIGCSAFIAWLYHTSVMTQHYIKGAILVAPHYQDWEDPYSILNSTYVNFKTVVVGGNDQYSPHDKVQEIAQRIGAKFLQAPHEGHLSNSLFGWQWGMKLMQEMLIH